ncbi:aldo/keto reductase [Corynebacterium sp.]|uniref:aldo/keto reductase n=1 Tax=Corynebacterium sp. TaxID=1720 RepID=UPI0026DD10A5|nr:aldo/keto reductase [Corynebacterium sp.]MDO4610528.1 aldo/keto reductase [Corynebacterium sp.]
MDSRTVPSLPLNDGTTIPQLGLGTWRMDDAVARRAVREAIEMGYRHIDTAAVYGNETGVGLGIADAIRDRLVERHDLFVTTKIWHTDNGRAPARASAAASLERLGLDYVDLLLVHWPAERRGLHRETFETILELREEGRTVSAGVSNFYPRVLDDLPETPAVNQIELHPSFPQDELVADAAARGMVVESWSPIGRGAPLDTPQVRSVAEETGATPAQVVLAWHLRRGLVAIPKSADPGRMRENLGAAAVTLTDGQMARIGELGATPLRSGADPEVFGNE